ncbi:MAG: SPASM domain-containing protein [Planctomycetes bacterium]|nr:SPASM domain-containing protein [Planctomycetota bacterium]
MPVYVDGQVSICDCQHERVIGDLFADPLTDIWNGQGLREHRRRMTSDSPPAACAICPRF